MKTQPWPGMLRVTMSPPCARTALRAIESPSPKPVRSRPRRCPNGWNSSPPPSGRPPHSSSTSIRRRASAVRTLRTTRLPGRVYLNALFKMFVTAEASSWGSALTAARRATRLDDELDSPILRLQTGVDGEVVDECLYRHPFTPLELCVQADVRQGTVHEHGQVREAPAQYGPRTPVDGDRASLQDGKREVGGVQHVPNFVRHFAGSFEFISGRAFSRHAAVLGHRFRDGSIETPI